MYRLASAFRVILFVTVAALSHKELATQEAYSAITTGWVTCSRFVPFDFRITHYTSQNKMKRFARLLKQSGAGVLRAKL